MIKANSLEELENKTIDEIDKILLTLSLGELEKLKELVEERRAKISVSPAYNNEIVSISKQILTFGLAGIGIVAAFARNISDIPDKLIEIIGFAALAYTDLILLATWILILFLFQSRYRYPFLYLKKTGNAVPYFYYATINKNTKRTIIQTDASKFNSLKIYSTDLIKFFEYYSDTIKGTRILKKKSEQNNICEKKKQIISILRDDIQQYFLLISYQGYVNQFELKITNTFIYGFLMTILSVIALIIFHYNGYIG